MRFLSAAYLVRIVWICLPAVGLETQKMELLRVILIFASFTFTKSNNRIRISFLRIEPTPLIRRHQTTTVPDCRDKSSLWCNPSNYPDSKVTDILSKNKSINQFLDKPLDLRFSFDPPPNTSNYENICEEEIEYIYPKAAKNNDGNYMFIVNNPGGSSKHRQIVKVIKCSRPDQECGQGELFSSLSTSCVQEYSDHKLVALSKTGEELVVDTFSFPSCCVCKIHGSLVELWYTFFM